MTPERRNHESTLTGYSPPLLKPKNRLRLGVFVVLNLAGYAAACLFWRYLQCGSWVDFHAGTIRWDLSASLGQVLLEPLSIFTHPWMILILGAVLAVLIIVPLAMAVMYPLLLALMFVVMTAVLAHAPLLALALTAGCLLAARSRLRREYPYLAALLGFVPVGIYLYLLTYTGIDANLLLPLQRWILAAPVALATLLTVAALAVVVWFARLLKFQPGVVWPGWLLLLPPAIAVFYWQIGPAELHYSLLIHPISSGTSLLASTPREEWRQRFGAGLNDQALEGRLEYELARRQKTLETQCEDFLRRYPRCPRSASVAWIAAQAKSLQRDRRTGGDILICYTTDWTMADSAPAWRFLLETYPGSPQAALAQWRLGELAFRDIVHLDDANALTRAGEAEKTLRAARDRLREIVARKREEEPVRRAGIFTTLSSLPRLDVYERALFEAEVLTWRIAQNDVLKDARCARALAELTALNPYDTAYAQNVKHIARKSEFQDTLMADNLQLAVVRLREDPYDRVRAMLPLAAAQRTDTSIEAHFLLGNATMQTAQNKAILLIEGIQTPEAYFKIVVAAPPNPWQVQALDNLKWLQSAAPSQSGNGF